MSEPKVEMLAFHCPHCSKAVLLEVLRRWYNVPEGDDAWEPHQWTAAMCTSCQSPFVLYQERENDDWGIPTQEYPQADRQLPWSVPQSIRDDFAQAQRCMRSRSYTAGAIMARRVVEIIRKDQGFKKGNLNAALKSMKEAGVIDARLYEWADTAREVGNEGAHDTTPVSREDAEQVLLFVEALVDYLYVFRKRYAQFQQRREALREGRVERAPEPLAVGDLPKADEKSTESD
jgi:Domain of unknown function (DUF4145)